MSSCSTLVSSVESFNPHFLTCVSELWISITIKYQYLYFRTQTTNVKEVNGTNYNVCRVVGAKTGRPRRKKQPTITVI